MMYQQISRTSLRSMQICQKSGLSSLPEKNLFLKQTLLMENQIKEVY
jgi:hypothetical protein